MKKWLLTVLVLMIPVFIFGENYASLWKKVREAEKKDLPRVEYEQLQKIMSKAQKGRDYGQLLKAQLLGAQVLSEISPDSLRPEILRIKQCYDNTTDVVLRTVYETVLYRVTSRYTSLGFKVDEPELTDELCSQLAQVKEKEYVPFVIEGSDSEIFGRDLLSIIGYELGEYDALYRYYEKTGNRRAACVVAPHAFRYEKIEFIDSLLRQYGDLPEAGEIAIFRYDRMSRSDREQRLAFAREALGKWGSWKRMDYLRNEEKELTRPELNFSFDRVVVMPDESCRLVLKEMRNLQSLTLNVYQLNVDGDTNINPSRDYAEVKKVLGEVVHTQTRDYSDKKEWEFYNDQLTVPALPVGVYMIELTTPSGVSPLRRLYFVTDVYVIIEPQPVEGNERYVVVSARTGQPIAGAHLRIRNYRTYDEYKDYQGVTDEKGEYIFDGHDLIRYRREVFAYTDADRACPDRSSHGSYYYHPAAHSESRVNIYTDRSIYRPGQTVHVSALTYQVKRGFELSVSAEQKLMFRLYDANHKQVDQKEVTTDAYGVAAVDFTLPASGLTGSFRVEVGDERHYIRVEEYKRPTFYVEFPEVKTAYAAGDTLPVKGVAMSYAGVPVQEGKVSYKVVRRTAFWWWTYSHYWSRAVVGYGNDGDEIAHGEAVTDEKGQFVIDLPLILPKSADPAFYNFVVTADVTDKAGETRSGQLSLPLGNRKTALTVDLPQQIIADDKPQVTIKLMNAAGQSVKAKVRYQIDDAAWQTVDTDKPFALPVTKLASGSHLMKMVCEQDTLERKFVLFSLDDQVPATKTDDWFYQSSEQFPADGGPVTIQVGSSDDDVHIVYSVFSGSNLIERGAVDRSNRLFNLKLTYEEAYKNGLMLTFAWVKNQHCYTHTAQIRRPLPDKQLKLQWTTFRDRLKPGQQEEWTLSVSDAAGKPVDAQLMATLYDKSLDQIAPHGWTLTPSINVPLPSAYWQYPTYGTVSGFEHKSLKLLDVSELLFSKLDESVIPSPYHGRVRSRGSYDMVYETAMMPAPSPVMLEKKMMVANAEAAADSKQEEAAPEEAEQMEIRENLNETAFFYPQLTTDEHGRIAIKFTLPECLTTWRFLGVAHTKDMSYGSIEASAVAQKEVMIQPNVPRFLRDGDKAVIAARIHSLAEKNLTGSARLRLLDAETNAVVREWAQPVTLKAGATADVAFPVDVVSDGLSAHPLLVCQMTVSGNGFSDGEQHYLPLLPATERVLVTRPISQHQPGTVTFDLAQLIPADATQPRLTVEYTDNPAWLMVQSLPTLGMPSDDNAISLAAAWYANGLGRYIIQQQPEAKKAFTLWKQEGAEGTSLVSQLEQNQELKDVVLNETPWVLDADNETRQKQLLADFFDDNLMQNRLTSVINKLRQLQRSDGSWSWWPGMSGSFYMTVAVSEMLVRLNDLAGAQQESARLLDKAFDFMGKEMVEEVKDLKKLEKEGNEVGFPSYKALQWLYMVALDGRELPSDVNRANDYLLKLLKKDIRNQTMYEKALSAVIFSKFEPKRALEYVQSLKEYTVYREDIGRYYDTQRAGYSWFDYTIPTQTVAIEALKRITPDDLQTVREMQRWLLQEKRTQAWDTPVNSVNAVYAFLMGQESPLTVATAHAQMKIDGRQLETPKPTAAIGYVKTSVPATAKTLTVEKTSEGTSWGAVYAQFLQPARHIKDDASGLTVTRELLTADGKPLTDPVVGARVKVRITIDADRDYDFVQVIDKRAACMEPVRQLSGYRNGYYCAPKDNATCYYFDMMGKGRHTIETEYYIDRTGTYETGACTVQCAYAPAFHGITKSKEIKVKK